MRAATFRARAPRAKTAAWPLAILRGFSKRHAIVLAAVIGLVFAAALVRSLLAPARFPVRTIRFVGNLQDLPRPLLVKAAAPFMTENFYALDIHHLSASVAQVPWVGSVRVERRFPRTLVVYINPVNITARWALGGWVSASATHVHLQGFHVPHGLPVFHGPAGQEAAMTSHYQTFKTLLTPLGLTIAAVNLSSRQTWRVALRNGPLLVLGHSASQKLQRFVGVFPQIHNLMVSMKRVDLRYTNGFAISWNKTSGEHNDQKR